MPDISINAVLNAPTVRQPNETDISINWTVNASTIQNPHGGSLTLPANTVIADTTSTIAFYESGSNLYLKPINTPFNSTPLNAERALEIPSINVINFGNGVKHVFLRGTVLVNGGTASSGHIATLPQLLRPETGRDLIFSCIGHEGNVRVDIQSDGIIMSKAPAKWLSLDNIHFFVGLPITDVTTVDDPG